jgi:flagellar basal-body rod protein FlgG
MLTSQRDINVRGNNLANLSTAGFKNDRLVATTFAEALAIRQQPRTTGRHVELTGMEEPRQRDPINWAVEGEDDDEMQAMRAALSRITLSRGRTAVTIMTDFSQGALHPTERKLDFAIVGEGFFIIESRQPEFLDEDELIPNPDYPYGGRYYTRNGQFQIDTEGYLVSGLRYLGLDDENEQIWEGDFVLDDLGEQIWVGTDNFIVNEWGAIFLYDALFNPEDPFSQERPDPIARLGIYNPHDPQLLIKNRENIFAILNEDFEPEELEFTGMIMQNYIERANTEIAAEIAGMMTASRAFQAMAQILQTIDATLGRSISEVGRV